MGGGVETARDGSSLRCASVLALLVRLLQSRLLASAAGGASWGRAHTRSI